MIRAQNYIPVCQKLHTSFFKTTYQFAKNYIPVYPKLHTSLPNYIPVFENWYVVLLEYTLIHPPFKSRQGQKKASLGMGEASENVISISTCNQISSKADILLKLSVGLIRDNLKILETP